MLCGALLLKNGGKCSGVRGTTGKNANDTMHKRGYFAA